MNVHDLPAADAVYRWVACHKKRKVGRPQNEEKKQTFVKVEKFLEDNDDDKITVGDLVEKMEEYFWMTQSEAYGRSHMKPNFWNTLEIRSI